MYQRTAIWATKWDALVWIRDGRLVEPQADRIPAEEDPAVKVAREQIKRDGKVIPENIERAILKWREQQTLKLDGPT